MERPSGVSSASEESWAASASSAGSTPSTGMNSEAWRLPRVAQGDGAGLVEHEDVDVAGGLDGAAGHGQHVGLVQTAHAGDADGGQQRADGSGSQAHEQRHERGHGRGVDHVVKAGREAGVTIEGQRDQDKDDGEGHQEDFQGDLVGRLLARGALDHRDHLVQEALAGLAGDLDNDPVGQHRGTAGNSSAPMVVGARHTSSATSVVTDVGLTMSLRPAEKQE